MISLGHRDISFVGGASDFIVSADRLSGYRQALDDAGIPFTSDYVVTQEKMEDSELCSQYNMKTEIDQSVETCERHYCSADARKGSPSILANRASGVRKIRARCSTPRSRQQFHRAHGVRLASRRERPGHLQGEWTRWSRPRRAPSCPSCGTRSACFARGSSTCGGRVLPTLRS